MPCITSLSLHPVLLDPAGVFGSHESFFAESAADMRFHPKNKSTARMCKARRAVPDTAVMAHGPHDNTHCFKESQSKVEVFKTGEKIKMECAIFKGQRETVSAGLFVITAGELSLVLNYRELSLVLNPQGTLSMFQATLNLWASLGVYNPMCSGRGTEGCPAFSQYRQGAICI